MQSLLTFRSQQINHVALGQNSDSNVRCHGIKLQYLKRERFNSTECPQQIPGPITNHNSISFPDVVLKLNSTTLRNCHPSFINDCSKLLNCVAVIVISIFYVIGLNRFTKVCRHRISKCGNFNDTLWQPVRVDALSMTVLTNKGLTSHLTYYKLFCR